MPQNLKSTLNGITSQQLAEPVNMQRSHYSKVEPG
jgi:hypothetical protein